MSERTTDKTIICCSLCGAEKATKKTRKGVDRLPPAWKRDADKRPTCGKCWNQAYRLNVCIVPVAEAVGDTKDQLWNAMRTCWAASTHAANLCIQTLSRADIVRSPEMTRMPAMPRVYLYGEAPPSLTGIDPASYTCVLHAAEARYRKSRTPGGINRSGLGNAEDISAANFQTKQ